MKPQVQNIKFIKKWNAIVNHTYTFTFLHVARIIMAGSIPLISSNALSMDSEISDTVHFFPTTYEKQMVHPHLQSPEWDAHD